jgi:hypothetical protein
MINVGGISEAACCCRAVKNVESLHMELSSYQSLVTHITSQSVSRLFSTLAQANFTPDMVQGKKRAR